jgi:hypothetical protein
MEVADLNGDARPDIVVIERHSLPAGTPSKLTVLTSLPPVVTKPPGGGGSPLPSPATGIQNLKTKLTPNAKGKLFVGRASNPPTASTVQTLAAKGKVLGRGKTTIAAGQTKSLALKLNRKARKRLKRTTKAKLKIVATGPTGTTAVVRKTVRLRRPKR